MKPEFSQRMRVLAWALWDWGTSAFSAVVTTFVFARYLVSDFFVDPAVLEAWPAARLRPRAPPGRPTRQPWRG
jgi:MFS-type transporter involved in bile tolerance (Atg22 family)